jgi:hypothetical protein
MLPPALLWLGVLELIDGIREAMGEVEGGIGLAGGVELAV